MSYGPTRQTRTSHCDIACFLAYSDGLGCACVVKAMRGTRTKQARAGKHKQEQEGGCRES